MSKETIARNPRSSVPAKIAAAALALLCALALTGCSDGEFSMEALMAWPFDVESDEGSTDEEEEAAEEEAAEEEEAEEASQSIEEVVLFDESGVSMTATGVGSEEYGGAYIEVTIANDSDSTVVICSNDDFSVGNVMTDVWLYTTVTPGKIAYEQIDFEELSSADELVDIEGSFEIDDEESYDVIAEPTISFSVE